jgi:predicted nucleic acid-binding protein
VTLTLDRKDAVIWPAARADGAALFLSEVLQDGLTLESIMVRNPFNTADAARLAKAFRDATPQ